ncbi:cell division protein FtsA [Bacteroidales bacterium OttesenSCG-928-C19]|nr:cell division protein FtsA [Bacteroidales bacterium OttesenSCG-928-C19]
MDTEIIVGLDIGTTKIACFIGHRAEGGKVKILGHGKTDSVGVSRGVVVNIELTAQSIQKAVKEAELQSGVEVGEVYVGIAGQHIKSMQNRGNIMIHRENNIITKEDLNRLIDDQHKLMLQPGEDIIHVLPQDFFVDGDLLTTTPIGVAGNCLEGNFHIITGHAVNIKNIHRSVKAAGYDVKGVVLEPIASAEAVLDQRDKDAGVALVDIGGGTTDVAIFHEGIIRHTSVIPMAGNSITDDIKNGCHIVRTQAEALKVKFGSCLASANPEDQIIAIPGIRNKQAKEISMKTLAGIIQARMEIILEQALHEIKISGLSSKLIGGIVLTGGGSVIKHAIQLNEYITGIDSRIGTPDEHLTADSVGEELSNPMYATGIGLVIYGIKASESLSVRKPEKENPVEEKEEDIKQERSKKAKIFGGKTDDFFNGWLKKILNDDIS